MKFDSKVVTIPNLITGFRFVLSACLAVLLMLEQTHAVALAAFLVFSVAAVSDWIDGYYARHYQSVTMLGKLMDPLADKVLVTTALIMLIPSGKLPAWIALVILCREIMVTGLRGMASAEGVVVAASGLGKVKSICQYLGLGMLIFPPGQAMPYLPQVGLGMVYVALAMTVWSGLDYFYSLRGVFLGKETGPDR